MSNCAGFSRTLYHARVVAVVHTYEGVRIGRAGPSLAAREDKINARKAGRLVYIYFPLPPGEGAGEPLARQTPWGGRPGTFRGLSDQTVAEVFGNVFSNKANKSVVKMVIRGRFLQFSGNIYACRGW